MNYQISLQGIKSSAEVLIYAAKDTVLLARLGRCQGALFPCPGSECGAWRAEDPDHHREQAL